MAPDWIKWIVVGDEILAYFPFTGNTEYVTIKETQIQNQSFLCAYSKDIGCPDKEGSVFWLDTNNYSTEPEFGNWTAYQVEKNETHNSR